MVRNPRKEVVHGKATTYESRHNCRCDQCVYAHRVAEIEREFRAYEKIMALL